MTTTAELINVLEDTASLLLKTQTNLKKCPKARLTKGYVEMRVKTIEEYWVTFTKTHQDLVKITSKEKQALLPYFTNEDYNIYEDIYLCLLADLRDLLATLTSSPGLAAAAEDHTLCHCKEFTNLQPIQRDEYVKKNNLCFNCLVPGHSAHQCRLQMSCRICKRRHHTLLHRNQNSDTSESSSSSSSTTQPKASHHSVEEKEEIQVNTMIASHHSTKQGTCIALLATATVIVRSEQNHTVVLRALVDQGSQASFISEKATQMLNLTKQSARGSIIGVGSTRTNVDHVVQLQVESRWNSSFKMDLKAYVMSKQLTTQLPSKAVTVNNWTHLEGLNLADPSYHTPGPIDLLLGVKEYALIVQQPLIKGPPGSPCAQKTNLGWILFGEINSMNLQEKTFLVLHHQVDMDDIPKSLWEINTDYNRKVTKEEILCKKIYKQTYTRTEEGRSVVKLPFNIENPKTPEGNVKYIARTRLLQSERRYKRTPQLKEDYKKDKIQANLNIQSEEVMEKIISQFDQFENLKELIKVIAYCTRFLIFERSLEDIEGSFTIKELEKALMACIKLVPEEEHSDKIERTRQNKPIKGDSNIKTQL
ncbi:Uncharacterized protein OBRU01_10665 [Operophtera brumata]|uniref:Uncharacterized protein n=1 Tax=Operophtera brumata TaxID=104452 RepID=A0A0L7LDY3_OPEBR|nr:Uncharacterized protein OBRU01_10665 [Operophtera brumata]